MAVREVAALLAGLGHHVEERAPALATDPALVMATIVAANTALSVRLAEQRLGREMTDSDFEILTLASAHNAQQASATDYVAAQFGAFAISRGLASFFETCDVFLCPTLCSPPLRIGEIELDVGRPVPYRANPAALYAGNLDVQYFRPARDVDAAGMECGRVATRHDVRGTFGERQPCSDWRLNWRANGPGRTNCRRFVPEPTKLSRIRERVKIDTRQQGCASVPTEVDI